MLKLIAFDADDTLWRNEEGFRQAEVEFRQLLSHYHDPQWIDERLYKTAMRNLPHFGYGTKALVLTMLETAIELTEGRMTGLEMQRVIDLGRAMIERPIVLLDGVRETLALLAEEHDLIIITKGDLLEQELKVERSGLREHFIDVEIVSRKDRLTYERITRQHRIHPASFVMVGNSLRSDVLPVLAMGGHGIHIPYPITWTHELIEDSDLTRHAYVELSSIRLLPEWITDFG